MALTDKLTAIGDAIREKTGGTELLTLDEMPNEIASITTGGGDLPEEALTISGNCSYRFCENGWNWFIEEYGNQITTNNITYASNMFDGCSELENIPFDINFAEGTTTNTVALFQDCHLIKEVPYVNNYKPASFQNWFYGCYSVREIPDEFWEKLDYSAIDANTSSYGNGSMKYMFRDCFSLRKLPMIPLQHENPYVTYKSYSYITELENLYTLDEFVDLPINTNGVKSNALGNSFNGAYRAKNITFALVDGAPNVVNWSNQTINLGTNRYVGYYKPGYDFKPHVITGYNSGITSDKEVIDDTTYQALKNDNDWFSADVAYSRYNHNSAVATINSLPDTTAYLAANGGTNTINFLGASGSATDGGAISNLTEEEIAVAAAKGWTVSLV